MEIEKAIAQLRAGKTITMPNSNIGAFLQAVTDLGDGIKLKINIDKETTIRLKQTNEKV